MPLCWNINWWMDQMAKKKLDLTCWYTVNLNGTTWLSTSVKHARLPLLKTVGYNHGMRGVKPPIIWGDVTCPRTQSLWNGLAYAQVAVDKPLKGCWLTVTILNWSFTKISLSDKDSLNRFLPLRMKFWPWSCRRENHPIDEAAREKLPPVAATGMKTILIGRFQPPLLSTLNCSARYTTTRTCVTQNSQISSQLSTTWCGRYLIEAGPFKTLKSWWVESQKLPTEVGPGVYDIHFTTCP